MNTTPKTFTEAIRYYTVEQNCIDAVANLRWVYGKPACPKCGVVGGVGKRESRIDKLFAGMCSRVSDWTAFAPGCAEESRLEVV